jgi:hypothetical protein
MVKAAPKPSYRGRLRSEVHRRPDRGVVKRFRSRANGTFRVDLAPGRYRLIPRPPPGPGRADPVNVKVRPHRFTRKDITYDSGLR